MTIVVSNNHLPIFIFRFTMGRSLFLLRLYACSEVFLVFLDTSIDTNDALVLRLSDLLIELLSTLITTLFIFIEIKHIKEII